MLENPNFDTEDLEQGEGQGDEGMPDDNNPPDNNPDQGAGGTQ